MELSDEQFQQLVSARPPAPKDDGPSKTLIGIGSAVLCFIAIHFFGKFDGSQETLTSLAGKVTLLEASIETQKSSTNEKLSAIQASLASLQTKSDGRYTASQASEDFKQSRTIEDRNNQDLQRQISSFRELQKSGLEDIEKLNRMVRDNAHAITMIRENE